MKTLQLFTICVLTILTATICTTSNSFGTADKVDTQNLVGGNTTFALELYNSLREQEGNLFFSPYSISTALAMTYAGARGTTEKQMAEVLNLSGDQDQLHSSFAHLQDQLNAEQEKGDIQLNTANALWPEKDYSFLSEFLDLTNKHYKASLISVDFKNTPEQARTQINQWVEHKTNNKILELIKPGVLNELTRLVLTNAIYFKGTWKSPFKESATEDGTFWLSRDKSVTVPLMSQEKFFRHGKHEDMQLLELPYTGDNLSMIVLLPNKVDGLPALEAAITKDNLASWLKLLKKRELRVFLPKFKMTSEFSLARTLGTMGMPDAFIPTIADFSGMTGTKELFISAVVHKAFVDVNEEGTEAAAATAVVMQLLSYRDPPPEFRADHPFLFLIRHNPSGSILFLGRVINPAS
jgi:serpin B